MVVVAIENGKGRVGNGVINKEGERIYTCPMHARTNPKKSICLERKTIEKNAGMDME